jgi:PAS domain S-box-containing protein
MQTHETVVSDVFESVQGSSSIAFHVPVFRDGEFAGSVAILIPFDQLARKYLEPIKIGKDGYAWMVSRKGIELFCPVPGHMGNSVFQNCKDFPTILSMAQEMVMGNRGTTTYVFDRVRGETVESLKKQAVYLPVRLYNTFWSIVVATPETEVLADIEGFRDRWLLIAGMLILVFIVWTYYFLQAFKILREEEKRKRAEEALRHSEMLNRSLVCHIPQRIFIKDLNSVYTWCNDNYARDLGVPPEEVVGKDDFAFFPRELAEGYRSDDHAVMTTGAQKDIEEKYVLAGVERWAHTVKVPYFDEHGHTVGVLGILEDITERKRSEEKQQEEHNRAEQYLDIAGVILVGISSDQTINLINRKGCELLGYSQAELIGRNWFDLCLPEQVRDHVKGIFSRLMNGELEPVEHVESYVVTRAGEERTIAWHNTVVRDAAGMIIGTLSSGEDITERKLAEEALRRSEEKFSKAFQQAPLLMTFSRVDDGTYIDINEKFVEISGFSREEAIGKTSTELGWISPEDRKRLIELLQAQGRISGIEITLHARDKREVVCLYNGELIMTRGGQQLLSIALDISERKKAQEEKERLQVQLLQAQKIEAVGRLAGGVAHDFNNMLSIIIGHAEMVLDQVAPDDPIYQDVIEMKHAAERSADLTRQLLAFARRQTISPKILDLNDTASGILKMLRRLIGEDINLAWVPGLDVWPVKMDPGQIDQILANLAVNARDAIGGVGTMTIETANVVFDETYCLAHEGFMPGSYVLLAVSDTGAGMDRETLDRVFDPFFTTKELGKGTGLGLSTVYGIVKQNNGFINVYSEPGRGTTFKIYIPRAEEKLLDVAAPEAMKDLRGTETVLLVEDEGSILALGKTILERRGYVVLAAQSPGEAMAMAQNHPGPIHLLITDVVMPEMNGRDLRDRLNAVKPGFKCIFMSGYTANVIAHHGVLEEGIDFLEKPFSVKTLAEKVRGVLDR